MAYEKVYGFEKLVVWQKAITLAKDVYNLTGEFPTSEKYGLVSQMQRAVVSVSSNIAEGNSRLTKKDKAHFTTIAYSSLMELLSQIFLSKELNYISDLDVTNFKNSISEISNLLNGLRKYQLSQVQVREDQEIYNLSKEPDSETSAHQLIQSPTKLADDSSSHPNIFVHPTAIIDNNCKIGAETKIWHFSHIMSNSKLGEKCNIGQNVVVSPEVELGDNVKVQNNVSIYTGVICENDVFLGPSMVFTNVINPRSAVNRKNEYLKTVVKKGASIGANATIVCGNNIGEYAFIGAGAVVTKSVPAYALLVGNPARQIGWISEFGHRLDFDENGVAICEESKVIYLLKDGLVNKEFSQEEGS